MPYRIGTLDAAAEHDDATYLDFIEGVKKFANATVEPAVVRRYNAAADVFEAAHGRAPSSMADMQGALDQIPIVQANSRLFRSTQDMRAVALRETYAKRETELLAKLAQYERLGPGTATLDPTLQFPDYFAPWFHLQPGGYAHPLAEFIYQYGTKLLYLGTNDHDERQQDLVDRCPLPSDGVVRQIVDLASAAGQSATAWKRRLPNARVLGVDISPSMVRYAHMRAVEMGLDVDFAQMAAEDLKLPDSCADVVFAYILFHEVPVPVGERVIREALRVLRPGGVFVTVDVGKEWHWDPLDAYIRDFIIRDNCEPWERGWAGWDFESALRTSGFRSVKFDRFTAHGVKKQVSSNQGRYVATK